MVLLEGWASLILFLIVFSLFFHKVINGNLKDTCPTLRKSSLSIYFRVGSRLVYLLKPWLMTSSKKAKISFLKILKDPKIFWRVNNLANLLFGKVFWDFIAKWEFKIDQKRRRCFHPFVIIFCLYVKSAEIMLIHMGDRGYLMFPHGFLWKIAMETFVRVELSILNFSRQTFLLTHVAFHATTR